MSFIVAVMLVASVQITAAVVQGRYGDAQNADALPVSSLKVKITNLRGAALSDATVTVVESGKSYTTDQKGFTPVMQVPFTKTALTETVDGDFSFVTLVVSKSGYIDYILYNCLVYKERMRDGPQITLFNTLESSAPYISTVEIPPDNWTKEFLNKIKLSSQN